MAKPGPAGAKPGPLDVGYSVQGTFRIRGRGITRLEALSDGIFAFSATLLVVSLEVPRTFPELAANLQGFGAFGLSFLALILIWTAHNGFFRRYGLQDPWVGIVNGVLLFVVLFFVYPLKYLSISFVARFFGIGGSPGMIEDDRQSAQLFIIYGLGFVAVFGCMALLYLRARLRADDLGLDALERYDNGSMIQFYLILAGMGLVSVTLSALGVGGRFGVIAGWIYGFLGPICAAHGYWRGSRRERIAGGR